MLLFLISCGPSDKEKREAAKKARGAAEHKCFMETFDLRLKYPNQYGRVQMRENYTLCMSQSGFAGVYKVPWVESAIPYVFVR
jgi:hypothetical protein